MGNLLEIAPVEICLDGTSAEPSEEEDANGMQVMTIIGVELYKSDTFANYVNQYLVGMDKVTEEDLLEFLKLQV